MQNSAIARIQAMLWGWGQPAKLSPKYTQAHMD